MHPRGRHGGPPWARGNDTPPPADDVAAWLTGRLPDDWYEGTPEVKVDRDEIVVVGELTAPAVEGDPDAAAQQAAVAGRITRFREETRGKRMAIAQEAEERYGRKVAWGAKIGDTARGLHQPRRTGHDPPALRRAPGARHLGRRRRCAQSQRGACLVRQARRPARGRLDPAAARRAGRRTRGTQGRPRQLSRVPPSSDGRASLGFRTDLMLRRLAGATVEDRGDHMVVTTLPTRASGGETSCCWPSHPGTSLPGWLHFTRVPRGGACRDRGGRHPTDGR